MDNEYKQFKKKEIKLICSKKTQFYIITTLKELNILTLNLKNSSHFSFYLHINTKNTLSILGIAFSIDINCSSYLPLIFKKKTNI
ncbi:MAG: hypothetical protein U0T63_01940 [Buchnera aphidicola (Nurudea shiraii)]